MTTSRSLPHYSYDDYVPTDGITCPICDSPCGSLQNLNKHLDTAHNEEDTKGAFLSWFTNAHKRVQTSLGAGGRSPSAYSPATSSSSFSYSGGATGAVERSLKQMVDPAFISSLQNLHLKSSHPVFFASDNERQAGEFISKEHWHKETGNDTCYLPGCTRLVGKSGAGKQHCRQCGGLFCEAHTQYEIKLNRQAHHDPHHGIWCKVCVRCFIGRQEYMETRGATRSKSDVFLKGRERTMERVYLESNRLEKRLEKLARIHYSTDTGKSLERPTGVLNSPASSLRSISLERSESSSSKDSLGSLRTPRSPLVSSSNSILSMKLKYREGEQTVASWEDDKTVLKCPLCMHSFTLTNRKHHCRLCGKVVCGSTRCSKMIPLFLNMSSDAVETEPVGDTRACCNCQRSVFRRKTKREESMRPLPIFHLYQQLSVTRNTIEKQLPKFHEMILVLGHEKSVYQTQETHQTAAHIRKSLLDNFALYDSLSKSIRSLPATTAPLKRLQANVGAAASMYLQRNMLPLQMLPRLLNTHKNPSSQTSPGKQTLAESKASDPQERQTQLHAYREQYALVEGFIQDAQQNRKYDDVKILKGSLEELRAEMDALEAHSTA